MPISVTFKEAAPLTTTKKVYLQAPEEGNERFAVYCFGSGEKWYDMTLETDDACEGKIYSAEVDTKYTGYDFCRMDGAISENIWANKWNQTVDLDAQNVFFKVAAWDYTPDSKSACTQSKTPFKVCVTGNWLFFAGESIDLTATSTGATSYQWYKGGTAEGNKIAGATSASYHKDACVHEDAGTYYCKTRTGEGAEITSEGFQVKTLRIYVNVGRNGTDYGHMDLHNTDPANHIATGMIFLGQNYNYAFSVTDGCDHYYGQNNDPTYDAMWSGNCTGWAMNSDKQCCMRTENGATYTFIVDYTNMYVPVVSVVYPSNHQEAGKVIYLDNDVLKWTTPHYRIGRENHIFKEEMTLVNGTANLYRYTTSDYTSLNAWHIADNCGWSGDGFNIYQTKTEDAYAITHSTKFEGGAASQDVITITPTTSHSTGSDDYNNNCEFYSYTTIPGMKTQNVAIITPEGGTITVGYTDVDGTAKSFSSGSNDLAHTCILTITATPDAGYNFTSLQVNGVDFPSGTTHILDADATITATFDLDITKLTPTFTWTYDASVKAGGVYSVSVATDGDADVNLSVKETIAGVSGSFAAGKPATGTVALGGYPAATTFTYRAESSATSSYEAKSEEKTVTIERCETTYDVTYGGTYVNTGSSTLKPQYFHETSGVGRITKGKGNNSYSTTADGGTFSGVDWTRSVKNQDYEIQTYKDNIVKIVYYVKCTADDGIVSVLKRSDSHIASDSDGDNILSSSTIIYNDNPSQTSMTKNAFETVTIIPASPLDANDFLYIKFNKSSIYVWGVRFYRAEGDVATSIAFIGETEIEKYPGDAAFTKAATQTTTAVQSGGSITYKSSDETVATVDKNTGEVTPLSVGHATITATLGAFGCFKAATASYSLDVKKCTDPACTIAVTAGKATKCSSDDVTMTATAASGATYQWYKDGVALSGKTASTLTTKEAGAYYVTATKTCVQVSNTIEVVNLSAPTATALHDYYYIKAGRVTPPIKLFQLTNMETWNVSPAAPAGCTYELGEDGIIYLTGTPSATLAAGNQNITVTVANTCGFANANATLELRSLEATAKPQIAWISIGTKGETLPGTPDAEKSTTHPLYNYLESYFDLTAVNAYCTIDERLISDYFSQFDLVLLTDYPDTNVKPDGESGGKEKSYSNAIGCLIDEKPILSFEAFVADCPNWGINSNPKTASPKQDKMTLLCSAHNIFAGTTLTDDKITVLSSISGEGLQGFTGLEAPPGMLFIATLENDASKGGTLVNCCERQKVIEARMMIMGLNYNDMANLTADGKLIIKQIINYLLQYTDIADCSIVFDDNNNTHVWSDPLNWYPAYNAVPKPFQAVRVDKPCDVNVANAHCSSIRLRKDGAAFDGKLTIQPEGGLTVIDYIKEVHGTNFMTTYPSAAADLVIQANASGKNGSLVFGNTEDDLQATIEYYSIASGAKTSSPSWQYIGIPIADCPMAIDAYQAAWMCSWESEGNVSSNWVWVENEDKVYPFKGYCITQVAAKKYTHIGTLNKPEEKALPMYYFTSDDGVGFNMFANSWVAPIDITKMKTTDFGDAAEPTIFIYNAGTRAQYQGGGEASTAGTNTGAGQYNAIPVNAASYLSGSLTKIPTMQGFFIQATKEGTLTLDYKKICFDNTDYQTTAETMRAPKRMAEETEKIVPEVMRIDVGSANWGDRLYILMHDAFSDAFDRGWDGSKQEGDADAPMLAMVRENGLLAVAAVETADERELSFRAGVDSIYTFTFRYEGETIYLYDILAQQATEIRTGNTYTFEARNKTAVHRFLITKHPPKIPTDINNTGCSGVGNDKPLKFIYEGEVYILRGGVIYDMTGRAVAPYAGKEGAL